MFVRTGYPTLLSSLQMAKELGEDGNCVLILKELVKDREKNKRGAENEYELWGAIHKPW